MHGAARVSYSSYSSLITTKHLRDLRLFSTVSDFSVPRATRPLLAAALAQCRPPLADWPAWNLADSQLSQLAANAAIP
jgi:hypothetical protein